LAVVLVVLNVLAFAIPFTRGDIFWLGYGFSFFAILFSAGAALYAFGREGLKSKYYGLPLLNIAWVYLVAQVAVGFIEMAVPFIPWWVALIVNIVILAATVIGLITTDMGSEAIKQIDQKVAEKVFYLRALQADIELLSGRVTAPALQKSLKELAEAIRYSDPMSSERLAIIENDLQIKAAQLANAVAADDLAGAEALVAELRLGLIERNKRCKLLKGI
jgi:hypothetical protein